MQDTHSKCRCTAHPRRLLWLLCYLLCCGLGAAVTEQTLHAQAIDQIPDYDPNWDREQILQATLQPYRGEHQAGVDASTLKGKVVSGYQGWFTCPDDGADRGWHHWGGRRGFRPGSCSIDLWPDVSELSQSERYSTEFRLADDSPAQVYSPLNATTVARHFQWMKDYGIDGVMVQRFGAEIRGNKGLYHFNRVLNNCRAGANQHGRVWCVMYDLSGLGEGETQLIKDDWKQLVDRMRVGRDPADQSYLNHGGKPLVAVWGAGFNDRRRYTLEETASLVEFLQDDPDYGGNAVMLGIPSYWRTKQRDAVEDPQLQELVKKAEIVSPWAVGRYADANGVKRYAEEVWQPDQQWCNKNQVDYLPVVFPGFSWHNMNRRSELGQIPRRKGEFLWEQLVAARQAKCEMVYVAMFDEMDEGTAIFKCSQEPPVGESRFLDFEGLPSDHYLWLVGQGGRLMRGELSDTAIPRRVP